jgi:hypothetical protein
MKLAMKINETDLPAHCLINKTILLRAVAMGHFLLSHLCKDMKYYIVRIMYYKDNAYPHLIYRLLLFYLTDEEAKYGSF